MAQVLEYDFIEKPSEDYLCPVTLEILTEPYQTLCCGNHLSQEAADRLGREGKPCPVCKRVYLRTIPDKFFKRQVNQLKVRCSKKALGCTWVGGLGDLEKHLNGNSVNGECKYTAVACPLCGDHIQRGRLEEHKQSVCPQMPYTCKHCGYKATYESVIQDHWSQCEKYPLPCPNNCRENVIKRQHLQKHLDTTCPLQVIECQFRFAGCRAKLQRQNMETHLNENLKTHLSMTSKLSKLVPKLQGQVQALTLQVQSLTSAIESGRLVAQQAPPSPTFIPPPDIAMTVVEQHQQKKIEAMVSVMNQQQIRVEALVKALNLVCLDLPTPPSPIFIPPPDFVVTDFEKHKKKGDSWYSPPFYSHIGGYKFRIRVDANGTGIRKGTHVGVDVHMMRGEYDDNLKWPFKGEINVQFLNQRGDKGHWEDSLLKLIDYSRDDFCESTFARVVGCEINKEGWGSDIAHTHLGYDPARECQYLMNDCLKFRVISVKIAP